MIAKRRVNAKIPEDLMAQVDQLIHFRRGTLHGRDTTLTSVLIAALRAWISAQSRRKGSENLKSLRSPANPRGELLAIATPRPQEDE